MELYVRKYKGIIEENMDRFAQVIEEDTRMPSDFENELVSEFEEKTCQQCKQIFTSLADEDKCPNCF